MTVELTRARKDDTVRALRRYGWISLLVGVLGPAILLFGVTIFLMQLGCQDLRQEPISGKCFGQQRLALSYIVSVATLGLHLLGVGSAVALAIFSIVGSHRGARWRSVGLLVVAAIVGAASAVITISAFRIGADLNGIGFYPAIAATLALALTAVPWAIIEWITAARDNLSIRRVEHR